MKFGLLLTTQYLPGEPLTARFQEHLEQVRAARIGGFDSIWASHHYLPDPYQMFQPLPLLARLAAEAGQMTVGTAILLIPLLNPIDIAEQVATLDAICGGRFILGVGLGYRQIETELFGVPRGERVSRFMETLQLIKRLWSEEQVDFNGRHYQFQGLRLLTKPVQQPRPPLWIAANSDQAIRRAARLGDTWLINPHATLTRLESQVALFRQSRVQAALPLAQELPLIRELFIAEDRKTALQEARPYLEQKYKTYSRWGQDKAMPGEDFNLSFEELIRDRFIIGDPADCIRQIERYRRRLGLTHLLLRMQWPGMEQPQVLRAIELLSKEVIPHFRQG